VRVAAEARAIGVRAKHVMLEFLEVEVWNDPQAAISSEWCQAIHWHVGQFLPSSYQHYHEPDRWCLSHFLEIYYSRTMFMIFMVNLIVTNLWQRMDQRPEAKDRRCDLALGLLIIQLSFLLTCLPSLVRF
jgi:hypothetical protein